MQIRKQKSPRVKNKLFHNRGDMGRGKVELARS